MAEETCLVFQMDKSLYAVDVGNAGSVEREVTIERLPGIPNCLLGITTIRGEVVPVVNLRRHFNLPPLPSGETYGIIVGRLNGRTAAYQVDAIHSISRLEFGERSEAPVMIQATTGCVQKVTTLNGNIVVMLNLLNVLSEEEKSMIADFMKNLEVDAN